MSASCPRCGSSVLANDKFCPQCGTRLDSAPTEAFDPVSRAGTAPDRPPRRRPIRPKKKPVYRRAWFLTLAILAAVIIIGSAGAVFYINQKFDTFNRISTPPSIVSLGGDEGGDVTTDPAQQALEIAASGKTGEFTIDTVNGGVVDLTGEAGPGTSTFTLRPVRQSEGGSRTILLMGVDARPGEPIDSGVRPDSLAVLHLNGKAGTCNILSIPRDTRTELPGYGQSKINHALAVGGVPYEGLVVEQLLGVQVDHFALIDFAGTEELVDAIGGVTVTNDAPFELDGHTFPAGELHLNGAEALAYARFRGDERGDFGRQERQQQIIRALIGQTDGMDVVTGANTLLTAVTGHFKTDMSPKQMIDLARDYRSTCTSETLTTRTFDGAIETHPDPLLDLPLSYVVLDPADIEANVGWLLGE